MKFLLKNNKTVTFDLGEGKDDGLICKLSSIICEYFRENFKICIYSNEDNLLSENNLQYSNILDLVESIRDYIGFYYNNQNAKPGLYHTLSKHQYSVNDEINLSPCELLEESYQKMKEANERFNKFDDRLVLVYPSKNIEIITLSNHSKATITSDFTYNRIKEKLSYFSNCCSEMVIDETGFLIISKYEKEFCKTRNQINQTVQLLYSKHEDIKPCNLDLIVAHFLKGKLNSVFPYFL